MSKYECIYTLIVIIIFFFPFWKISTNSLSRLEYVWCVWCALYEPNNQTRIWKYMVFDFNYLSVAFYIFFFFCVFCLSSLYAELRQQQTTKTNRRRNMKQNSGQCLLSSRYWYISNKNKNKYKYLYSMSWSARVIYFWPL